MKRRSSYNNLATYRNNYDPTLRIQSKPKWIVLKINLKKITASRTQGAMLRSKARWYEFGEKENSKYFYNLERRNCKKKHITSLTTENNTILSNPKLSLEEEANFYKQIYSSKSTDPENKTFASFFESVGLTFLNKGEADQCEGLLTLEECAKAISNFKTTASLFSFIVVFGTCSEN